MKPLFKGLDNETQLLVAVGAAVDAGCIPCLETITAAAVEEGIDNKKLRAAAVIGQFVKDQPAGQMKQKADELLGTHLDAAASSAACPLESETAAARQADDGLQTRSACGCG